MAAPSTPGPPLPETLIPSQRARRDRIVAAALALLRESDYERIQMRDVAERADVALGTVYRYFASKEHLFAAVLGVWGDSLRGRVRRSPLDGTTPAERLDDLMGRVLSGFDRLPQFLRLIVVLDGSTDSRVTTLRKSFNEHTEASFLEPLADLDPTAARDVISVTNAVLWSALTSWSQGSITIREARVRMTRCIELIFSPGPNVVDGTSGD